MYKTECECGGDLVVVAFVASTRIPLSEDGFSTDDGSFSTEDEVVECVECGKRSPLQVVEK